MDGTECSLEDAARHRSLSRGVTLATMDEMFVTTP